MFLHQYNYRESQQRHYDAEPEYSYDEADDYGRGFNYDDHTPSEIGDFEAEQAHGLAEFDLRDAENAFDWLDIDKLTLDEFADLAIAIEEAKAKVKATEEVMNKRYDERRERNARVARERAAEALRQRQVRALERELRANAAASYVTHKH